MPSRLQTQKIETLTEADIWSHMGPVIWEASRFEGRPCFYPVYRWRSYYSYSMLALLELKGTLRLNPEVAQYTSNPDFIYLPPGIAIDGEIERVGAPLQMRGRRIRRPEEFIDAVCSALKADLAEAESLHPGFHNLVLVGGKDSLNLLLLPWRNPVVAASARPNFTLVQEFVRANRLDIPVIELSNDIDTSLRDEALLACCRICLHHARWGGQVRHLCDERDRKVLVWKGQLGGVLMKGKWRSYPLTNRYDRVPGHRLYNIGARIAPLFFGGIMQRRAWQAAWTRGAGWQGVHMAVLRELTQCLILSGYHGRNMRDVLEATFYPTAVTRDVRPEIGDKLLGRSVAYPEGNPGPEPWLHRRSANGVRYWCDVLTERTGVRVESERMP